MIRWIIRNHATTQALVLHANLKAIYTPSGDELIKQNQNPEVRKNKRQNPPVTGVLHPAWLALIRHCRDLDHGEISQLRIQDGIPVMAVETTKKVKFI